MSNELIASGKMALEFYRYRPLALTSVSFWSESDMKFFSSLALVSACHLKNLVSDVIFNRNLCRATMKYHCKYKFVF